MMGLGCGKIALMSTVQLDELEVAIVLCGATAAFKPWTIVVEVLRSSIAGIAVSFAGHLNDRRQL